MRLALAARPMQDPLEIWLGGAGPDAVRGWDGSATAGWGR